MTEIRIGDQMVRYDREATAAVHGTLEHGECEECGCVFCQNFAVQRDLVYPTSFNALLEQLGVDPNKEGEVFECGPVGDGRHVYGGWFYLVGEMVTQGKENSNALGSHHFSFFTTASPNAPAFHGGPLLANEFTTHVKWASPKVPSEASDMRQV